MYPGELHFQNEEYKPEMADRTSEVFKQKAAEIENEVGYRFIHPYLMRRTNCAKHVTVLTSSISAIMVLLTESMKRENLKSPVAAAKLKSWFLKLI